MDRAVARAIFESTDPGRPSSVSSVPVSAAMMPVSEAPRGLPRRNTLRAVPGSIRGGCRTFERKMTSVTQGTRLAPRPNASCRFSKDARRFAFRLASRRGLSTVCLRPSVVQTQLWASPSIVPGRLLISTSRRPAGVKDEQIDLVDPPLVIHELEVRPCPPRLVVRQMLAEELQSLAFPLVRGGANNCPTGWLHGLLCPLWLPGGGACCSFGSGVVSMNCRIAWRMTQESEASRATAISLSVR